jgi:hypothetical protein
VANAKEAIYTYGNRNPQGMTKHPVTGAIWEHEHGPQGGDEINIVKKKLTMAGQLLPMVLIMIILLLVTSSKRRHSRS